MLYFLFDIDRTLWDFDKNSKSALCKIVLRHPQILQKVSPDAFYVSYGVINKRAWEEFEKGHISKDVLRWIRFYHCLKKYGIDDRQFALQLWNEYMVQIQEEKALMPGAVELLTTLKSQGAKMAVVSNGFKEIQYGKLERSGILDFFDAIVISDEVGYRKPSPNMFRIALERLSGLTFENDPEDWRKAKKSTLMIGDDFELDIEGAQIFGIAQFYLNLHGDNYPGATYEGGSLEDVLKVILQKNIL